MHCVKQNSKCCLQPSVHVLIIEVKGADPSDSFRTIMDRVKRWVEPLQTVEIMDRLRKHTTCNSEPA